MAITNEQFSKIKEIINQRDEEYRTKINNIKEYYEAFLKDKMAIISRYYKHLVNFKILGLDEYLFNVNYENDTNIKFYICLKLDEKNINLNRLRKTKVKISKRQKLYNEIIYNNQQDLPLMEDVASDLYKEILKDKQPDDVIFVRNNVVKLTIDEEISIEFYVAYELEDNIMTYFKNTHWLKLDILNFYNNFYEKNVQTQNNFTNMIKIFKALEKEIVYAGISQIYISRKENLVETLLYNVPTDYFIGTDTNKMFLRIINYLLNANFMEFKTIDGLSNMLDIYGFNKEECENLCRKILYAYNNFDTIIDMSAQFAEDFNKLNNINNRNDENDDNSNNNDQDINNNQSNNPYDNFKNKFKNK